MAGPKHNELPAVVVPQHLWLRTARPVEGKVVQWVVPLALVVVGLSYSAVATRVTFVLLAIVLFVLIPALVLGRLEQLGRQVAAADRKRAQELLGSLPQRPLVRFFAPLGWTALQMAQLRLRTGDGQGAATGFADLARLCQQPDAVMLVSAQAHAWVLAGERSKARDLLQKLSDAKLVGPRDQLDLGIVLLIETKKFKQALSYIEAARKTIGDHPRVLAAQALAQQKIEHIDEASELLEQVQIAIKDQELDPVTEDLVKRARKGLQDFLEGQLRRERRARSRRTTIVVSSEAAASEIVSGEISGGSAPAPNDSELRRFQQVEAEPPPQPVAPAMPRSPEPDAPQPGLDIDLYSVPRTSAHPLPKREESVSAALASVDLPNAPTPGRAEPEQASPKPAETKPTEIKQPVASKPEPKEPEVAPSSDAPRPDSDAPVMRRRQTLITSGEPGKPAAPNLPSLTGGASAVPRTGLPTRATRHDGNPLPAVGAPATSLPTFRAPNTRNPDKGE